MNEGLISQRYAKALFRYAKELGVEELVYEKMKLFLLLLLFLSFFVHSRAFMPGIKT